MRRVLLMLLLALWFTSAANAQMMRFAEQVFNQLVQVSELTADAGLSVRKVIIGRLDEGDSDTWTLNFDGSGVVVGVCDQDCSDVDLEVKEGSKVIGSDDEADDEPVVRIPRGGRYSIKVSMYRCSSEPCYFGFAVFE